MLLPITISLVVGTAICQATSELPSPAPLQHRWPPYWASPTFRYECFQDCRKESHRKVTYSKSVVGTDRCDINCGPNTIKHTSWTHAFSKSMLLTNPKQPTAPRTACMLLVAKEDISCALLRSRPATRGNLAESGNFCRKVNYRYYLGKSCDDEKRSEVGEETCREACATGVSANAPHSIDNNRTRAIFRPCYRGLLARGERYVEYDFCSVELRPCSKCFKWGNWTLYSPCSRTCGSPGVRKYTRGCYVMDRSDILGSAPSFSRIENHFCIAYIGGTESRTEKCGMHTVCPQWTNWGAWSLCKTPNSNSGIVRKKCRTRRPTNITTRAKTDIDKEKLDKNNNNATESSERNIPSVGEKSDNIKKESSTRRRVCLPKMHGCPGDSLQTRFCVEQNKIEHNYTTDVPDAENCDDEETDESTTKGISKTHQLPEVSTENSSQVLTGTIVLASTSSTRINPKKPKKGNNRTFTVENEGGFTSVINNYAAVLITCLLVFIVVLLFALITICWKIMKRSRPNRYEAPPPSFSAGTLGSIPAMFGHGYPPPMGLRNGSGTFGRSEYPPNLSDAISSKGSWRSSSSNATNKGRSRNKRPPLFAAGVVLNAGSIRQQAKYSKASGTPELTKHQQSCNEPNMGSKKPSSSSLLSSASSAAATSASISTCPFQPLPPIPPDLPPGPSTNGKSFKKRNASRSSSHSPDDASKKSMIVSQNQSRDDSLSGKPIEMSHLHDERSHTPQRRARGSLGRRLQSTEHQHVQLPRRGTHETLNTSDNNDAPTENEYWSVAREEDALLPSDSSPPLGEIKREHKPLMRICGQRATECREKRRLRSYQSSDSAEFDSVELVDNVLYDEQQEKAKSSESNSPLDGEEQSEQGSDFCVDNIDEAKPAEPFYNSINPSVKGTSSDSSAENEDEYDHLYKDSSTPNSPKGPHTMRVVSPTIGSSCKGHNYESIDITSKSQSKDMMNKP